MPTWELFGINSARSDSVGAFDSANLELFPMLSDDVLDAEWWKVPRQHKVPRVRKPYGQGIDARRTSVYRQCKVSQSMIYQFLQHHYGSISHAFLLELVGSIINSCPEWQRPIPPSRSAKRIKAGVVAWMESNVTYVLSYVNSHHNLE
jgi:hypothetical protein